MSLTPKTPIPEGAIRYNTDSNKMEVWIGDKWMIVGTSSPNLGDSRDPAGTRAVFMGGFRDTPVNNTHFNTIDYITISTAGDAQDFGDLLDKLFDGAGNISSRTRQFSYMGRRGGDASVSTNAIEFITYSSTGNSTDFGDSTSNLYYKPSGFSNATRGMRGGGSNNPSTGGINVIDFITMASEGNAVDFGDLATAKLRYGGGVASPTRGIFLWGNDHPAFTNTMEFVTIATTGNAQDFGDLLNPNNAGAAGNATRGFSCSNSPFTISSIQLATLGNSIAFGSLSQTRTETMCASSPTRGIIAGGVNYPVYETTIDYLSIQEGGQAVDFGDLTVNRHTDNSGSNAHGGL